MTILVVDIGGTYMRLALSRDGQNFLRDPQKIKTHPFPRLEDALLHFVQNESHDPATVTRIAIAKSNRNAWVVNNHAIQSIFPEASIAHVNDFAANAAGIARATPEDMLHLGGPTTSNSSQVSPHPKAIIGPGTGLGLAYITAKGDIQANHGGHMLPALTTPEQIDLFAALQSFKTDGTIPIYEDALSGNGLLNIYKTLAARHHLDCEYTDTHHLLAAGRNDPLVQQSLKFYHDILGQFAHQVLAFGYAYGGLYLTGGITDRLIGHNLFDTDAFLKSLYQNNIPIVRNDVLSTPVFWVKDEFISLKGLLHSP